MGQDQGEKMAPVLAVLLLFVLSYSKAEEETKHIAGIVNGTVDLPPVTHIPKTYRQIKWFYNKTQQILTKKATKNVNFYRDFGKKMRLFENGTLHIMSLQKEDSSKYKIIVEDEDGSEIFIEIQLDVYDPVPKPRVNVTDFKMTKGKCVSTLKCSVDIPNVFYTWYENDKKYSNPSVDGNLNLSLLSESNLIYNCNVCNSASCNNESLYYQGNCQWRDRNAASSTLRLVADSAMTVGILWLLHNLL